MNIDFSNEDVIFMYGHFKKQIQQLNELKKSPSCPISKITINKEIKLFTSLANKLEESFPSLSKLNL